MPILLREACETYRKKRKARKIEKEALGKVRKKALTGDDINLNKIGYQLFWQGSG